MPPVPQRLQATIRLPQRPEVWHLRRKPTTTSISMDVMTVFTFDGAGRPWSWCWTIRA